MDCSPDLKHDKSTPLQKKLALGYQYYTVNLNYLKISKSQLFSSFI